MSMSESPSISIIAGKSLLLTYKLMGPNPASEVITFVNSNAKLLVDTFVYSLIFYGIPYSNLHVCHL